MREGWHCGVSTVADLNADGYLDIVVGIMGHYERYPDTFLVLYGGPSGYSRENALHYAGGFSPGRISAADLNNDGYLDLVVPAYSTKDTRVLPIQIFWGGPNGIDLEHPTALSADAGYSSLLIDLDRDGWKDLFLTCHRNDLGHQSDSVIFWNGPSGLSCDDLTKLPSMGPHWLTARDFGNTYTREPVERYVSEALEISGKVPARISWDADVAATTFLRFQLRFAEDRSALDHAAWRGPSSSSSYYERSGEPVAGIPAAARWFQYRAEFGSPYGCSSPRLRQVRIDF